MREQKITVDGQKIGLRQPRIVEASLSFGQPVTLLELSAASREGFLNLRRTANENILDRQDRLLLTSQTFITQEANGTSFFVTPESLSDREQERLLGEINQQGEVTFSGIVSFGRKKGQSVFTVATYCTVPLKERLTKLPENLVQIQDQVDYENGVKVGYRYYRHEEGKMVEAKRERDIVQDREEVLRYAFGQTAEVVQLAQDTAAFDALSAPLLEEAIETKPYNNLSFLLAAQVGSDKEFIDSYRELISEYKQFLDTNGGDCHFLTLEIGDMLQQQGFSPQVVIYPLQDPTIAGDLHSAIAVSDAHQNRYFLDPGRPWPFAVPVGTLVPLLPFSVRKDQVWFAESSDQKPSFEYFNLRKAGEIELWRVQDRLSLDQFKEDLPSMLAESHSKRTKALIVFPDKQRTMRAVFIIDLKSHTMKIKTRIKEYPSMTIEEFFNGDHLQEIKNVCQQEGINFTYIERALQSLSNGEEGDWR